MTSINYGQVLGFWGHKWRPNVEAGYDFDDDFGNQRWVFRAGLTLLLPSPQAPAAASSLPGIDSSSKG